MALPSSSTSATGWVHFGTVDGPPLTLEAHSLHQGLLLVLYTLGVWTNVEHVSIVIVCIIQSIFLAQKVLCALPAHPFLGQLLATTDLFIVPLVCLFQNVL